MPKAKISRKKRAQGTESKITVISRLIRNGDMTRIANRLGYDVSHVSRVVRGQRNNAAIVDAMYSRVSKRKVA